MKSFTKSACHCVATGVRFLLIMGMLSGTAWGTVYMAPMKALIRVDLSRDARRALEIVACRPFNVTMQASTAISFDDDDSKKYDAAARCAPHATLYKQPVVFQRICRYAGGWNCGPASEMLLAKLSDRRVYITAEGVSLTEAYWIVSYIVSNGLLEPTTAYDYFEGTKHPLDTCHISAQQGDELSLKCRDERHRVERIRSNGSISYRQIPPGCATGGNGVCGYGP